MSRKPTKYAHVVGGLPKLPLENDPDRLGLMNMVRDEIRATPADELTDWNLSAQILSTLRVFNARMKDLLDLAKKSRTDTAAALARGYVDAQLVLDTVGEWKSSAQLLADAYEGMWLQKMEEEGLTSMRTLSGATVSYTEEPYGKVVDKEAFRLWCINNGYESKLQLWPSTMSSVVKERTLAGEAPPDGVEVYAAPKVRLTKG